MVSFNIFKFYRYMFLLIMITFIISLIITSSNLVLVQGKTNYTLQGWRIDQGKWTGGLLFSYYEMEWVPYRLTVSGYDGADTIICIQHDYDDHSGHLGVDEAGYWFIGPLVDTSTPPDKIPEIYGPDDGVFTVSGPTIIPGPNIDVIEYCFTITDSNALISLGDFAFYWRAHLAGPNESSLWSGASLHAHTSVTGKQDVPIKAPGAYRLYFGPNEGFSGFPASNVSYNVYLINNGNADVIFDLYGNSTQGAGIDLWLEQDMVNSGDVHIAYDSNGDGDWDKIYIDSNNNGVPDVTVAAGETAVLIVNIYLPITASGDVITKLKAKFSLTLVEDELTLQTIVSSNLPWPRRWYQFGSDDFGDASPSNVDDKSFYGTFNETHVFFRFAESAQPDKSLYKYDVFLDTKAGGFDIGGIYYDYRVASDGTLYTWDGTSWVAVSTTYVYISGTSIVLCAKISDIQYEYQDVYILARTYEGATLKDEKGPYMISRTVISEMPLFLVPIVATLLVLYLARKRRC
ncbi:MAG: hypothetical protein DRO00_02255 [Thermoproteota archaeon]|nr:MAG: hypothetical protein DRO00_02255 [Candidatus Korarchaeota archaeon]